MSPEAAPSPHPLPDLLAGCVEACRGCPHRRLSRQESTGRKTLHLREVLAPWRDRLRPLLSVPDEERWDYRDKALLHATWTGTAWNFGLLREDEVVPIPHCPVHTPRVRAAAAILAGALPPPEVLPLAYLLISGGQATLVVKTAEIPPPGWLPPETLEALQRTRVRGLWLNLHPAAGRRVLGSRGWRLVWGAPRARDAGGLIHGPASFRQALPVLHRAALEEARQHLDPRPGDALLDLYCGTGASLRCWRERGAACLGVELSAEALICAERNAPGATRLQGRCGDRLPQAEAWLRGHSPWRGALLHANPPRTGLEPAVSAWAARRGRFRRAAYLSCSPGTLARDLAVLEAGGLRVERLQPYDFLPQTRHVEVLALLSAAGLRS